MKIIWTRTAKKDLIEIIDYIANTSSETAFEKFNEIKESVVKSESFPEKGRMIPELKKQNIDKYRELIVSPWRIMYKIEASNIYILAVIDGRRNIEDVLLKRQIR
ncbi:plasmid stabilization protein [Alkalispirochaeta sphaeroplastigenens]|uniref:Plasmid stabilization protein n=1 Tax=Alkalispirochaeta sphaeroplastigenens TaxID=1187066 RepID=A0A2S4JHA2_9SPIO|nr:type II toxin-antitoxin system RelE/ParE family toxin [Alkalispirochaeta sphaeroplastigenens]POQ98937.1 plasmid stabilization protein [Alkalispirochaeta sphaeroplastigenens]